MNSKYRLLGGVLLVAGTTIGAGMLALPVISGFAGFIPAVCLLVLFWAYMTYTAFLILEGSLSTPKQNNLIYLAKTYLGKGGEWASWVFYLFLLYSLTTAYLAGSGPIIREFVEAISGYEMNTWLAIAPMLLIFGFFVFKGTRSVDYLNRFLMIALGVCYLLTIIFTAPYINLSFLTRFEPKYLLLSISIVATSFGFHIIIPSLCNYLHKNVNDLKKVIWIGSLIPLIIYIIWEFLSLGIIPVDGQNSLTMGFKEGLDGANLLSETLSNSNISLIARFFAFFAIITSFLGVSLSLFDCLADSLHVEKNFTGKIILFSLTFIPPLLFALYDPRAFLTALEYAGAFGVVMLLGLIPALIIWSKRYVKKVSSLYIVPGGKPALILVLLFSLAVILLELASKMEIISIKELLNHL